MVEEQVTQLQVIEVYLVTDKLDITVTQKLIPGRPGSVTAATFFKF